MIVLLPALIPSLVTLGPLLIVKPLLLMVVLPVLSEPSVPKSMFCANLIFNAFELFVTTAMLLSVNLPVAPPLTSSV